MIYVMSKRLDRSSRDTNKQNIPRPTSSNTGIRLQLDIWIFRKTDMRVFVSANIFSRSTSDTIFTSIALFFGRIASSLRIVFPNTMIYGHCFQIQYNLTTLK